MSEKFWISTVKSRIDKRIEGHEFTWEEFVSKFENPLRTSETLLEYASMDSDARANAKDVGGIIPGHFLGDNRKDAQVEDIRLLKLDVDEIPSYLDFVSCVESVLQGYSFFVHSTHSHTKAAPRYRVFILLSRNVTSEEYGALAAVVEKKFPISFDEHGRSVKQIMYWPSVCKDGEYIFKSYAGEALNVDALLSKAKAIDIPVPKKTVEDPLSKPGLIGAFNRAHSITDILNEILSDIYEPTSDVNRYRFKESDSVPGAMVYQNDTVFYSNHAHDPAGGQARNAFDLVRIHMFGKLDECAPEGTKISQLPSHKAMLEYAYKDEKVKQITAAEAYADFEDELKPDFIYEDAKGKRLISCPLLADYIRRNLAYKIVRNKRGNGALYLIYEEGCYRYYSADMFRGVIKKYITDYDRTLLKMRDVEEVFKQITTDTDIVTPDELNTDEDLINFRNGMLRISDLKLLPHSPKYLSTIQIDAEWTNEDIETPNTDYYLNNLTDYDDALIQLLYQFIGVILSNIPGWRMKKALFLVGPGDTGKSLLKSLVEKILGKDNYIGMDLKDIEARFGTGNIYGMRLAGSSDMSFLSIDELKTFKKCTGGDSLFAEFKGQDGFEFTYKGLLWFCMNKAPKFGGDNGEWVYNRIMLVRCENVIPAAKQDKHLLDKMYAERAGIVHRAVMALKSVIDGSYRFAEPDTVLAARKNYMTENNTVISFFEECMQYRVGGKIKDGCTTGKVYDVYKAWCKDNNHGYAKTAKEFRDELARYLGSSFPDITCRRGKGGTFYKDYTLTDEAKERYSAAYGYDPTQVFSNVS